ncbi:hypothetical protein KDA_03080 [Dictyobacter alpinus]|uniref:O-antigen ligase-related domain-containing protein n=1 Tax=Dictyobacter alpinus TaxID=2014873 RepID=A0A402B0E9_9CHLR|nr:O-antigen ligase family protein [Dictyobacter alpinus]GCE24824.1 hypothetical protein KDA_03080 [Dictyobacter alpinus]
MSFSQTNTSSQAAGAGENAGRAALTTAHSADQPDGVDRASFWHDRLIEIGLIFSMALYYLIGNENVKFHIGNLAQLSPLFALPFLCVFIGLAWYRLPFAVALLPLALPYYLAPKDVIRSVQLSPAEIILWICLGVALVQFAVLRRKWPYKLSLQELRQRLGPFLWPILLFVLASIISLLGVSAPGTALRAFRQEILDPLIYVGLIFCCLRSRPAITRLLVALFTTGLVIAFIAILDYVMFGKTDTVYGGPPSVGLLFDYTLPIGLAIIFARISWKVRLAVLLLSIPFIYALLHNDSRGSALAAFPVVLLFVIILAIRNRKVLLVGGSIALVIVAIGYGLFYPKVNRVVMDTIINGHADKNNVTTLQRRVHLWQSAEAMIHDYPWFGVGLDNWLCHYANPRVVPAADPNYKLQGKTSQYAWMQLCPPASHYYIVSEENGKDTHMYDEPGLSHPHNIFLHVWVSIGVFGLLAFVAFLVFFYWLFARILRYLDTHTIAHSEQWRWMTIGVAAAMLAAIIQGLVDSSFLAQDLVFCFWLLIATLLIIRRQISLSWR